MLQRRIILASAFCFIMASTTPAWSAPPKSPQPVLALVDALDRTEPIDRQRLEHLLGRPLECVHEDGADCAAHDVALGDAKIGDLDFRIRDRGSILILSAFSPCVPVDALKARYGPLDFGPGCTDGVICIYLTAKRSWGKLSIGLGEDVSAPCARSIVLDSFPD